MNPLYKQAWITALRSGEYPQGVGLLRRTDHEHGTRGYCCMGVLCDIVDPKGWAELVHPDKGIYSHRLGGGALFLRTDGLAEVGITEIQQHQLTEMNDCGESFVTIAKWVEENL